VTYDPYDPYEPAPPEPERWGLNLPLAIGVVTVFLIAVIAWVIIDATGADDGAIGPTVPPPGPTTASTLATGSLVVPTTSTTPPLLPSTVPGGQPVPPAGPSTVAPAPATAAPAPSPTTAPPAPTATTATTLPPASGDTVPGDLGVASRPMTRPVCTGGYITVLASNVASQTSAAGIEQVLAEYPDSEYLRTDQSCPSLDRSGEGEPIYVVYFGPFPEASDACLARSEGPDGAYARQLSNDVGPDHAVNCN
jgi:hypothetical protein